MIEDDFQALAKARLDYCLSLLSKKSGEYSRFDDKLWNFKVAGQIAYESPEEALKGMWLKHLFSVFDIIQDVSIGVLPDEKVLAEKITDNINYLLLLEGLIKERMIDVAEKAGGEAVKDCTTCTNQACICVRESGKRCDHWRPA